MKNKNKIYNYINVILDIFITFLIQIFIIFLIIVIPSIIIVMKDIGSKESADVVFMAISSDSVQKIILQSPLIKVITTAGACIALISAPIIYEKGRNNKEFKKQYLHGLHIDIKQFMTGIIIGAVSFLVIVVCNQMTGSMQHSINNLSPKDFGYLLLLLAAVSMYIICQELFCRYYVMIKAKELETIYFFIVANILFVYSEYRNLTSINSIAIASLCLLSILLTVYTLRTENISLGAGFRIVFTFLSFLVFNAGMISNHGIRVFDGMKEDVISGKATGILNNNYVIIVLLILNCAGIIQLKKGRNKLKKLDIT